MNTLVGVFQAPFLFMKFLKRGSGFGYSHVKACANLKNVMVTDLKKDVINKGCYLSLKAMKPLLQP